MNLFDNITQKALNSLIFKTTEYFSILSNLNIFSDLENEHCTLEFDFLNNVVSGNEVIITDDLIVKCNNRDFTHLDYYLQLHYYYIPVDVDNSKAGEVIVDRLIKLEEGDNIIQFENYPVYLQGDCELIIFKNKQLDIPTVRVKLSTNTPNIRVDGTVTVSAVVTDDAVPQENVTVNFYDEDTFVGSSVTDENGIATYTLNNLTSGGHNFSAVYNNYVSNSLIVNVRKIITNITLLSTQSTVFLNNSFTLTGVLIDEDNNLLDDVKVKLYDHDEHHQVAELTTENGSFSKTINVTNTALKVFYAIYEGNNDFANCTSETVEVEYRKQQPSLTARVNSNTIYYPQNAVITGVLTDEEGNRIKNATLKLYNGYNSSEVINTTTTNNDGEYTFITSWNQGTYYYKIVYEGNSVYKDCIYQVRPITMNKAPTSVSATFNSAYNIDDTILISVSSDYGDFNPSNVTVKMYHAGFDAVINTVTVTEKDNDGNFKFIIPAVFDYDYNIVITYEGDNNYSSSSKQGSFHVNGTNLGSIALSRNGSSIIGKFKDTNNSIIPYVTLSGVMKFTYNSQTYTVNVNEFSTDADGEFKLTVSMGKGNYSNVYMICNNITSNVINFTL